MMASTIRVGMTHHEVYEIVDPRGPLPEVFPSPTGAGHTWCYLVPRRSILARDVQLDVDFDGNARVIGTYANGVQVQP